MREGGGRMTGQGASESSAHSDRDVAVKGRVDGARARTLGDKTQAWWGWRCGRTNDCGEAVTGGGKLIKSAGKSGG